MRINSKGLQTDLFFWQNNGTVVDRGNYLRIETSSNPDYYWGNLLLFEQPPAEGDYERWQALFEDEFSHQPAIRHKLFGWQMDADDVGVVGPFLDRGFELETNVVLLADGAQPPPRGNDEIEVREIGTESEWQAIINCQISCRHPRFSVGQFAPYIEQRFQDYRRLIRQGRGKWYGAFLAGRLVGDLGLFHTDKDTGRFQYVETDPAFRRRGICGTLVYRVARLGFEREGLKTLVMVADAEYDVARIYESVGFKPREKYSFCCLYPPPAARGA